MSEAAVPSLRLLQIGDLFQGKADKRRYDHLRYPLAVADDKGLVAVVDDDNADLAAIIRVYGTGRIDQGNAVPERQTTAWPDLGLVPCRQC